MTKRTIALTSGIAGGLQEIISLLPSQSPDEFVFQSERGTHLWRDNVWRRQMQPRLATVGLEWAAQGDLPGIAAYERQLVAKIQDRR